MLFHPVSSPKAAPRALVRFSFWEEKKTKRIPAFAEHTTKTEKKTSHETTRRGSSLSLYVPPRGCLCLLSPSEDAGTSGLRPGLYLWNVFFEKAKNRLRRRLSKELHLNAANHDGFWTPFIKEARRGREREATAGQDRKGRGAGVAGRQAKNREGERLEQLCSHPQGSSYYHRSSKK